MCFGSGGSAKKARKDAAQRQAEVEQKEYQRQYDVALGKGSIDEAFSRFDDDYFKGFRDDFTGYYLPNINEQFGNAKAKLAAALAERGMGESTVGAGALGDVFRKFQDTKTEVSNRAMDESNLLKKQVEDTKSNLYALNQASADPTGINAQAFGQASTLVAPSVRSPIGDVFSSVIQPYLGYVRGRNSAPGPRYASPFGQASGSGSGSVVR